MKPINLKKAEQRKGVKAINVFLSFGKLIKFDLYMTMQCAWHNRKQGECYTLSLKQASEKFPHLFTY